MKEEYKEERLRIAYKRLILNAETRQPAVYLLLGLRTACSLLLDIVARCCSTMGQPHFLRTFLYTFPTIEFIFGRGTIDIITTNMLGWG